MRFASFVAENGAGSVRGVSSDKINVAIEGCCHGELDQIYQSVSQINAEKDIRMDLLLICGDFQAVRNEQDLATMACPPKYREMNTFYKYYSGEKVAPVLTIFIGGNHEASNHLAELPYGGWVAPNIYYLGHAGVVQYRGITIAGISGIYKGFDFDKGHHEFPPYSKNTMHSTYHVRNLEVYRLLQFRDNIDIFISHDWPSGIHQFGNTQELLRKKRHFEGDIARNDLGSVPNMALLSALKPTHYFAAHLHVKFAALYPHDDVVTDETAPFIDNRVNGARVTRFLALDKVLPGRPFLQFLELPCPDPSQSFGVLKHHPEWLAILKATDSLSSISLRPNKKIPRDHLEETNFCTNDVFVAFPTEQDLCIKAEHFVRTAPVYSPPEGFRNPRPNLDVPQPPPVISPYTTWLCNKLGISYPIADYLKLVEQSSDKSNDLNESLLGTSTDSITVDDADFEDPSFIASTPGGYSSTDDFSSPGGFGRGRGGRGSRLFPQYSGPSDPCEVVLERVPNDDDDDSGDEGSFRHPIFMKDEPTPVKPNRPANALLTSLQPPSSSASPETSGLNKVFKRRNTSDAVKD